MTEYTEEQLIKAGLSDPVTRSFVKVIGHLVIHDHVDVRSRERVLDAVEQSAKKWNHPKA